MNNLLFTGKSANCEFISFLRYAFKKQFCRRRILSLSKEIKGANENYLMRQWWVQLEWVRLLPPRLLRTIRQRQPSLSSPLCWPEVELSSSGRRKPKSRRHLVIAKEFLYKVKPELTTTCLQLFLGPNINVYNIKLPLNNDQRSTPATNLGSRGLLLYTGLTAFPS